ncbi:MAG: hypothetical protein MdMp014T_2320 [Treponematales bacterium]
MIQFYFLSILLNAATGFVLLFGDERGEADAAGDEAAAGGAAGFSFGSDTFRLVLGVLTLVTGVLKLFSPLPNGNNVVLWVVGDLLPALVGAGAGFVLLCGYYRSRSALEREKGGWVSAAARYHKLAGLAALAAAVLHFLFGKAPLL